MSTIENINGFQLFEVNNEGLNYDGEWITIIKNKNELPYAKLKCSILYYERATAGTGGSATDTADDKMFYRKAPVGGKIHQSGWMRGFPLFDIGDTANWTDYNKILSAGWEYDGDGATYYRPPTIDLSGNTDISNSLIVIDFQNLPRNLAGDDYLRGDLKYLVLRLKWSEEKLVSNAGAATVSTYERSWYRRWYTYTYYCDIVNPSECLDFNTNLLRMKFDPGAISSKATNPLPWWLTVNGQPSSSSSVDSYTELTAGIKLYPTENDIINAIFPTYDTPSFGEIPDIGVGDNKFPGYFQLCVNRSSPTTQGNWRNYWNVAADEKTYPSELFDYPTPATSGWLTTIDISKEGNNEFGPDPSGTYIFKNALWYSLQSPIWLDLSRNQLHNNKRYIINFSDTSGGYGRDANTIDMTRKTSRPYYSNTAVSDNPDTNDEYDPANSTIRQYASLENNFQSSVPFTTTNYYDIFFKLLILPKLVNTVSVKYTFGQDISSVVTFWRGVDPSSVPWCDGSANPTGIDNSKKARRSRESITLKWDNSSTTVDPSKNIPIKRIRFIDIAAGACKSTPTISQSSPEDIFNDLSDNNNDYDISSNVFQIRLRNDEYTQEPGDVDYDQTKAMIKNLNIAEGSDKEHTYLIDRLPRNYIPYRMAAAPWNKKYNPILDWTDPTDGTNFLYFNPWKIISDPDQYDDNEPTPEKENATLLQKTDNPKIFREDNANISNITFSTTTSDNSFNLLVTPVADKAQEFKAILVGKLNVPNEPLYSSVDTIRPMSSRGSSKETRDRRGRLNPTTLEQENLFIPDYWQWNGRLFSLGASTTEPGANIKIFKNQLTCAGIVEPVNVQIYQQYMLINTAFGVTDQINIAYPTPATPESNTETTAKTEFIGGDSVDPPISQDPASMKFTLVGVTLQDISGGPNETKWPYTKEFDEEVTYYNYAALFRAQETYPWLKTAPERKRWNNLYKLNIKGANDNAFNINFITIQAVPDPIYVNCVELPPPEHLNNGTMLNASNTKVTIIWKAYYFDEITQGDIYWTVTRTNVITLKTTTLLSDATITPLGDPKDYRYVDSSIRIYDKYYYTVSGVFKWKSEGLDDPLPISLSLPVGSFTSSNLIVCINNQFPFGRYNTTSTNLKLYRPLRLTAAGGQCSEVDEFGNTSGRCTGGVCQGLVNGVMQNLYNPGRSTGGTRNIYHNTTNQLTGKQIYVLLAKSASRPFR